MIKTIHRRLLEEKLSEVFAKLRPGKVLDAGGANSPYRKFIPATQYLVLEKHPEFKPDICCDVHDIKAKNSSFDTVVATELLEHTENPRKVVSEFLRVLKKGGVCIASTPFIYPIHEDKFMKDYWRFTENGLREMFGGFSAVEVHEVGSFATTMLNLIFIKLPLLNRLSPLAARARFGKMVSGFVVYAVK